MGSDLLALALRRDADARDELAARLTSLNRTSGLDGAARLELEALLVELREQVSPPMRQAIDASLRDAGRERRETRAFDDELVELAMTGEPKRLVALARRPDLSLRVSGILAARGHLPALHALAGNRSATIGHSVLLAMAELSLGDPALRSLTIRRYDLPDEAISLLWPHLPDAEKAALLHAQDPYGEDDLGELADEAELRLHAALRRGELPASLDAMTALIDMGKLDLDAAIVVLCAEGRFADLGRLLSGFLSLHASRFAQSPRHAVASRRRLAVPGGGPFAREL